MEFDFKLNIAIDYSLLGHSEYKEISFGKNRAISLKMKQNLIQFQSGFSYRGIIQGYFHQVFPGEELLVFFFCLLLFRF